jgi:glutamate dehydrogenase
MVLDGTAAGYDPNGLSRDELHRLVLNSDLERFDPERLGPGGLLLFRTMIKTEGLRELHRRVERRADGSLHESWMALDDFYRDYEALLFRVQADLFIPAGGRPETIDAVNWGQFLLPDGTPSARVIIEGANSFITPEARLLLQKSGVVLMRDASANKCGVISSSYEIIANLLLSEQEFFAHKDRYVQDVLSILRQRAGDEARLLLRRHREAGGTVAYTELSDQVSQNINSLYHRLFQFFTSRPELCLKPPFRDALVRHLPGVLKETPRFRRRISKLPLKYQAAILAAEIGASLVYSSNCELDFEDMVRRHLARAGRC